MRRDHGRPRSRPVASGTTGRRRRRQRLARAGIGRVPDHRPRRATVRVCRVPVARHRARRRRVAETRARHGRHVGSTAIGRQWRRRAEVGRSGGADGGGRAGRVAERYRPRAERRVGPDVALRVADAGGGGRPRQGQNVVPGRVATTQCRQRGDRAGQPVRGRVHVQPVQGRVSATPSRRRGRVARRGPAQDDRPERARGPRVHVSHPAQRGRTTGRHVQGHGRHGRVHVGQAHELHARVQLAQRR